AGAARLEADEEHRDGRIGLEAIDALRAVHRAAVEVLVPDLVLVERLAHELQHRNELAEDEDLVAAGLALVDQLAQRHELAAVLVRELARYPEQARVASGLAQLREAREAVELALCSAGAL